MKSRAKILRAFNEPLVDEVIEVPLLEPGQVLVKILAAGVCGSDVHMWRGEDPRTRLPMILGHEGVGIVADIGGEKRTVDGSLLKPGGTIIWNRGVVCGRCRYCTVLREPSLCSERRTYGITIPCDEKPYLNGCYADHIILHPRTDIFTVSEGIDPSVLVSASCSGATIAHAFESLRSGLFGRTVVVQGVGPLGVYAVAFASALGASRIIVIEGSASRLELCRTFGATHLFNIHESTPDNRLESILALTDGFGADVVIEAAGARGAAGEGIRFVGRGGTYVSTGYAQPVGAETIDFYRDVVRKNVRIQGIWVSDTGHLRQALALVEGHAEMFARLVTHRFTLDRADEALCVMEKREALKAVIVW